MAKSDSLHVAGIGAPETGESLVDTTCDELRRQIVSGELPPGSRIVETETADRLGVSRRTVQSVLSTLQREGLVLRPGGLRAPWMVAPLTIRGLREICHMMGALECWVVRFAAELPSEPRTRLAAELRAVNAELREAISGPELDAGRAAELDGSFHSHLVDAVAGKMITRVHRAHRPMATLYIRSYMEQQAPVGLASAREHDELAAAIESGDPDAAERALRANWLDACERYAEIIKRVGERGIG